MIDDGSKDGSSELCDEIAAREPRCYCIHQENKGVSTVRNAGIEYVLRGGDGGYMAFLDADDFWLPNVLTAELLSDEQSDLVAFCSLKCNQDASQFAIISHYPSEKCVGGKNVIWRFQASFFDKLYSAHLINTWSIRYDAALKYNEDKIFQM